MTDKTTEMIEYQELSEDRRRAIETFIKGTLIAFAVIAFGLKLLIDSESINSILIIGIGGIVIIILGIIFYIKCENHDKMIRNRLNQIAQANSFSPIISTTYIFNAAFFISIPIEIVWIIIFISRILNSVSAQ